jgi:hypothetical protein
MNPKRNHDTLINRDIVEMISWIDPKLQGQYAKLFALADEMETAYPDEPDWDFLKSWLKKTLELAMSRRGMRAEQLIEAMEADAGTRAMQKLDAMIRSDYKEPDKRER